MRKISIDRCEQISLLDTYSAALGVTGDTPGTATSIVRAYASVLAGGRDDSSPPYSAEETEFYQVKNPGSTRLAFMRTAVYLWAVWLVWGDT